MFPDPPESNKAIDLGKTCTTCGRNLGGPFTMSHYCRYCRPITQDNGRTITKTMFKQEDNEWERVPNTTLEISENGKIAINAGDYSNSLLVGDVPTVDESQDTFQFTIASKGAPTWKIKLD